MTTRKERAQITGARKARDRDNDRTGSWSVAPTPTSIRREQAEKTRREQADEEARRQAEVEGRPPRSATGARPLTPAEVTQVAETYERGLVRRAGDQRVREHVPAVILAVPAARTEDRPVQDVQAPAVSSPPPAPPRPALDPARVDRWDQRHGRDRPSDRKRGKYNRRPPEC